jgi:hypothetical protein
MGIAVELHMDDEMDDATFKRLVAECGGYFEDKGMHEVVMAISSLTWEAGGKAKLEKLGIADLALLLGTLEDLTPEEMAWRTPLQVAAAADRVANLLAARNPDVAFVVDQFEERFGNEDETARELALEFENGQGSWALLEMEVRSLAKVARWLAANGVPRVTFVQIL